MPWSLAGIDGASLRESENGIGELVGIHHPFSQLHPFLPTCLITSRNDVIPPGYNGTHQAASSFDFSLKRPLRGSNHLENTGLTGVPVIQQKGPRNLETTLARRCPAFSGCHSDHRRESRKRCVGDRKFSEMMAAMSFIARWMKISDAGRDNKFVDRISLTSLCYSFQE